MQNRQHSIARPKNYTDGNLLVNLLLHRDSCIFLNTKHRQERTVRWHNPYNFSNCSVTTLSTNGKTLPTYRGYEIFLALMHSILANKTRSEIAEVLKILEDQHKASDSPIEIEFGNTELFKYTNYDTKNTLAKSYLTAELSALAECRINLTSSNTSRAYTFIDDVTFYRGRTVVTISTDSIFFSQFRKLQNNLAKHRDLLKQGKSRSLATLAYVSAYNWQKNEDQRFLVTAHDLYRNFDLSIQGKNWAVSKFLAHQNITLAKELSCKFVEVDTVKILQSKTKVYELVPVITKPKLKF